VRVLTVGDVCGKAGMRILERHLWSLRREAQADCVIVNAENAHMLGVTPSEARSLLDWGADVLTLGNHSFKRQEIREFMDESDRIVRPANYPVGTPGDGMCFFESERGTVCVINLLGRCDLPFGPDNPFAVVEKLLPQAQERTNIIFVDFHAEATSEKCAMAYHLDGRVSAVFGTHTHVQTADERIFPGGTGFITDLGMTGAMDSVIGVKAEQSLAYFRGDMMVRFSSAEGTAMLNGALFDIDEETGLCVGVERVWISE